MVQVGESGEGNKPAQVGVTEFLPRMVLVLIEWKDAMGGTRGGWRPLDTMHAPTADCQSVGWVVEHNEKRIVICPHKAGDDGDGEIAIPPDWVQKITPLTVRRSKRNQPASKRNNAG